MIAAGRILLAADSLGAAQYMLDAAVDYAKEREQFGRVIRFVSGGQAYVRGDGGKAGAIAGTGLACRLCAAIRAMRKDRCLRVWRRPIWPRLEPSSRGPQPKFMAAWVLPIWSDYTIGSNGSAPIANCWVARNAFREDAARLQGLVHQA